MSASVRELEKVLDQVREGTFKPDATRSGYFVSPEGLREEYDYEASGSEPSMDDEDNLADVAEEESACETGTVLKCGRLRTANFEKLGEVPRFLFPTRKRCF